DNAPVDHNMMYPDVPDVSRDEKSGVRIFCTKYDNFFLEKNDSNGLLYRDRSGCG
ncbi:hypothetical protein KI387_018575, partial [Taxus chinensis]